jgi:uncharacterized protein involved in exopolysaccharide biosynthesis
VIDKTPDTGQIVAISAAAGSFLAALVATWRKLWPRDKPQKPDDDHEDYKMLAQRIETFEKRMDTMDGRINDVFRLLGDAATSMASAQADIREAKTRLEERRRK